MKGCAPCSKATPYSFQCCHVLTGSHSHSLGSVSIPAHDLTYGRAGQVRRQGMTTAVRDRNPMLTRVMCKATLYS